MKNIFEITLNDSRKLRVDLGPLADYLSCIESTTVEAERFMEAVLTTYAVLHNNKPALADQYLKTQVLLLSGTSMAA